MNLASKKLLTIGLTVSCGFIAQTASALPFIGNGPYIDGGIGYGYVNQDVMIGSTEKKSFMYGLEFGYYLFHGIGVEAGAYYFPSVTSGSKNVADSNYSGQISVRASLPIMLISSLFCKLGMGLSHTNFGNLPTQVSHPDKSFARVTGFGAVGIKFSTPIGPTVSVEGIAFTNNDNKVPSRYGALATVGWDF